MQKYVIVKSGYARFYLYLRLYVSLCLKAVLRKLARWRKKTSAALERGREHEKQHWPSKKEERRQTH